MKKLLAILACSLALVAVMAPAGHAIGAYGIWWHPDEGDSDGYGAGVRLNKSFTPLIMYDLRVSYVNFTDTDFYTIPLEATVMAKLGMLYGGLGYGYYVMGGDANLENDFGWYFLAGIQLALGGNGVFGEVKWQDLETDVEGSNASADIGGVVFHVGMTLGIGP